MRDRQTNHPRILRNSHVQRETNTVSGFCLWSLWKPYMIDMVKLWYEYAGCGFYVTLQPSLPQRSLCELHPTQTCSNWPLWCCLPNLQGAWKHCQIASNCTKEFAQNCLKIDVFHFVQWENLQRPSLSSRHSPSLSGIQRLGIIAEIRVSKRLMILFSVEFKERKLSCFHRFRAVFSGEREEDSSDWLTSTLAIIINNNSVLFCVLFLLDFRVSCPCLKVFRGGCCSRE